MYFLSFLLFFGHFPESIVKSGDYSFMGNEVSLIVNANRYHPFATPEIITIIYVSLETILKI